MVKGYSFTQIRLHWIVAALVVFQLIFGEDMTDAWRTLQRGGEVSAGTMVWTHILAGIAVLALALWRLPLRLTRGVPEAPVGEGALMKLAGAAGHWGLYALMIAAPVSGLLAWYGGIASMGEIHEITKPLLIIVIALHVLAALFHQFVLKDGLVARMRKPLD